MAATMADDASQTTCKLGKTSPNHVTAAIEAIILYSFTVHIQDSGKVYLCFHTEVIQILPNLGIEMPYQFEPLYGSASSSD